MAGRWPLHLLGVFLLLSVASAEVLGYGEADTESSEMAIGPDSMLAPSPKPSPPLADSTADPSADLLARSPHRPPGPHRRGRRPGPPRMPAFLRVVSPRARREFFDIFAASYLTKAQQAAAVSAWAVKYNVTKSVDEFFAALEKRKAALHDGVSDVLTKLPGDFDTLWKIVTNQSMTADDEIAALAKARESMGPREFGSLQSVIRAAAAGPRPRDLAEANEEAEEDEAKETEQIADKIAEMQLGRTLMAAGSETPDVSANGLRVHRLSDGGGPEGGSGSGQAGFPPGPPPPSTAGMSGISPPFGGAPSMMGGASPQMQMSPQQQPQQQQQPIMPIIIVVAGGADDAGEDENTDVLSRGRRQHDWRPENGRRRWGPGGRGSSEEGEGRRRRPWGPPDESGEEHRGGRRGPWGPGGDQQRRPWGPPEDDEERRPWGPPRGEGHHRRPWGPPEDDDRRPSDGYRPWGTPGDGDRRKPWGPPGGEEHRKPWGPPGDEDHRRPWGPPGDEDRRPPMTYGRMSPQESREELEPWGPRGHHGHPWGSDKGPSDFALQKGQMSFSKGEGKSDARGQEDNEDPVGLYLTIGIH